MDVKVYLQVLFVICSCVFREICGQGLDSREGNVADAQCSISIRRTRNNTNLILCPCNANQPCTRCLRQNPECIQLEQADSNDEECGWILREQNRNTTYCFRNCLLDFNGSCMNTEISPCIDLAAGNVNNVSNVTINCLTDSAPTSPPPPPVSSSVAPTTSNTGNPTTESKSLASPPTTTVSVDTTLTHSTLQPHVTSSQQTLVSSPSSSVEEQPSLLTTTISVETMSTTILSETTDSIVPTSTTQSRVITSSVQIPRPTSTTEVAVVQDISTESRMITPTAVVPSVTTSQLLVQETSTFRQSSIPHQITTTVIMPSSSPRPSSSTVMSTATEHTPTESTSVQPPHQNVTRTLPVETTSIPTTTILTTATPTGIPTMSTQETTREVSPTDARSQTTSVSTTTITTTKPGPKPKANKPPLSNLAIALISVFGALIVVIAIATGVTLLIICHSSRKKQKTYRVRNGHLQGQSHAEPVYSEVFEPPNGHPEPPHVYESMSRYMLPSYSLYKKRRFPKLSGSNKVQIKISDTHEVKEPETVPPSASNGVTLETQASHNSNSLQVDGQTPNPYETPVSSLADVRDLEGYTQVRDGGGAVNDQGYTDVRFRDYSMRSYSLGDIRHGGYANIEGKFEPRIYESPLHSPTGIQRRFNAGYVNLRDKNYFVLGRSYSLDDIRNRPYVNVAPPTPLGDIRIGGYTDASSRKPIPRRYESPVGSMEDVRDGGYSDVSPPRPRSYESPVCSVESEGRDSTATGESCDCEEPTVTHADGGYSKLDTALLDGYAILEPYIPGRNNIYSHLRHNI